MRWSSVKTGLPRVVILGRPNVGKSTLFNRLSRSRRAITDPTPGVTRDPVETECTLAGHKVLLVDTGGLSLEREDLAKKVSDKSLDELESGHVALLVLDATKDAGEDQTFIGMARKYSDKIILVVNKVDTADRDALVYEKFNLGFSSVIGVSAEHGRNIDILENEIALRLSDRADKLAAGEGHAAAAETDIRIAILGKPNTGKSTLLNALLNENRSIVSEVPGTTRDVIEGHFIYKEMHFTILDTAGIRKKKKVSEAVEYYSVNRAIKTIDDSDIVVLLIDAQEGFTEQDKKIANLIDRKGRGFILCLNKWDLTPKVANQLDAMRDRIEFIFPYAQSLPILPLSAMNSEGIEKLLDTSIRIQKELFRRVDTGELNRALGEWVSQYHLPDKTRIRIRYMTQVGVHPVQFVIFTNSKSGFPDSYLSFLRNRIREKFGFHHVPIQIEVRTTARQTP